MVDESLWSGRAPGKPFGLEGRGRPLEFRLLHVVEFCRQRRHQARERVGRPRRHHAASCRRTDMAADQRQAGARTRSTRTRKDLLRAASRLMKQGRSPPGGDRRRRRWCRARRPIATFRASRRCWWRPSFDVAVPEADELFGDDASRDPVARLQRVETALHDMILANEPALRTMLAHTVAARPQGRRARHDAEAPEPPHAPDRGGAGAGARAVQAGRPGS